MTTTAASANRSSGVLRAAAGATLLITGATVALGAAFDGSIAARSALVGGAITLVFFGFGAVVVGVAARLAPATALLVALMTYTLQVVLVALVFVALTRADAFAGADPDLSRGWLCAGLLAATFTWMTAQLVVTARAPLTPLPGPGGRRSEQGALTPDLSPVREAEAGAR